VSATLVLLTLLLAPETTGGATASPACETWSRSSTAPPAPVGEWFAHSTDERVRVCQQPAATGTAGAAPLYFGEGRVTQRGTVCSYLSHGLTLTGSGAAAHLQRYDRIEALTMALAGADCPRPHIGADPPAYVETYDVSPDAFVAIMRLWSATLATPAASGNPHGCCGNAGPSGTTSGDQTRARIQAALGAGRTSGAAVTRIVRMPGSLLRHRYALFIHTPDAPAGSASLYVIYVDKRARGPYEIRDFAETN